MKTNWPLQAQYIKNYTKWLIDEGYQNATIKKHVKFIKKVLNTNSHLYKLDQSFNKPKNIKIGQKKPFWLHRDEVALVVDIDFKNERLQRVCDEWLFQLVLVVLISVAHYQ